MTDDFKQLTIDTFKELSAAVESLMGTVRMLRDLHEQEIMRLQERMTESEIKLSEITMAWIADKARGPNDFTGI